VNCEIYNFLAAKVFLIVHGPRPSKLRFRDLESQADHKDIK